MRKIQIAIGGFLFLSALSPTLAVAQDSSAWQWSNTLQTYYYRDNGGVVHYADGSSGGPATAWQNGTGQWVYSANSSGPADKSGHNAIQAQRIDITSVGAAPTVPPANAVTSQRGANNGAAFGGTDSSQIVYVAPNSQAKPIQTGSSGGAVFGPSTPQAGNSGNASMGQAVFGPGQAASGFSYTVKVGPSGENVYYFKGAKGENIYYSN